MFYSLCANVPDLAPTALLPGHGLDFQPCAIVPRTEQIHSKQVLRSRALREGRSTAQNPKSWGDWSGRERVETLL
jgi:hypothetical protein